MISRTIWIRMLNALPPNMTVEQVSGMFRCSPTLARKRMREAGYHWSENRVQKLPPWVAQVNWSLSNMEIALQVGRSRERVRQYRNILGKKKVVPWTGRRPKGEAVCR